jgi:hypothetical protein
MFRKLNIFGNSFAGVLLVLGVFLLAACSPLDPPSVSALAPAAGKIETQRPESTHTPIGVPTEATATPAAPRDEFEFRGQFTERNGNVWVIGEFRVTVTERTEIKGDPQLRDWLKVHAVRTPDGLVAREIEVLEREATRTPEAEIEFRGQLTAIESNIWIIGEFRVIVTERTEIKGDPQLRDWLKVHAVRTPDGLVAREIEVLERDVTRTPVSGATRIEFTGTLTAINGSHWTVNGVKVIVGNTEIKDNPQIGDTVKVEGTLQADGSVLAREIEKENASDRSGDDSGPGSDDHSGGDESGGDDNRGGHGGGDDDDDGDDDGGGDHSGPGGRP